MPNVWDAHSCDRLRGLINDAQISHTLPKALDGVASGDLIKQVTRGVDYDAWTTEFLEK